ncbi:MAG: AI-2E family transporter [Planctomycetota bacterium]
MDLPDKFNHQRVQSICLVVITVILGTFSIYWLRPVLVPLVVALFVVSGVTPMLKWLENRLGVNRLVASGLSFVLGLLLMTVFAAAIWGSVKELRGTANDYLKRVEDIVDTLERKSESIGSSITALGKRSPAKDSTEMPPIDAETETEQTADPGLEGEAAVPETDPSKLIDAFLRNAITEISQVFLSLVSNCVVVLIYVFFLLIGTSTLGDSSAMAREIDDQIRSYLSLKTVISIFTGGAFGLTLYLFGVPMALTFGVLAFLLNFIPNVGPLVASLLPVPLILLDPSGNILWMVGVITATGLIQVASGNLVEPKMMGDSSNLHPVTILVALMFWGMMWGIVGMFLATPLTSVIRIFLHRVPWLRSVADLMSGRLPDENGNPAA